MLDCLLYYSVMDKYLVKSSRPSENNGQSLPSGRGKRLKQTTIQSLAEGMDPWWREILNRNSSSWFYPSEAERVVNVDELARIKKVLDNPNESSSCIIDSLKKLQNIRPSKEVLLSIKVGHSINKLRKHQNLEVKNLAIIILKDWKQFYKELRNRQEIEVKYDAKTTTLRSKATKLINTALSTKKDKDNNDATMKKSVEIERYVFKRFNCRPNAFYKQMVRKVCLSLKNNDTLKNNVLINEIEIAQLCAID